MNDAAIDAVARAMTRRGLLWGLAVLAAGVSGSPFVLDEMEAKKRKRKRKKRKGRTGNGGGRDECRFTRCGKQCVDLDSDPDNCGACGAACAQGSPCVGGFCVAAFGGPGAALGQFDNPAGIAFAGDGSGFVADSGNTRIVRFRDGAADAELTPAEFISPVGVAVSPISGALFVVDKDALRVFIVRSDGELLGAFGGSAEEDGGFVIPAGIAINPQNGRVFVADFRRDRINEFTANGTFLRSIGRTGSGNGEFNAPFGMACDDAGSLFIADSGNHRVHVLDGNGAFVRAFGRQGSGNGEFDAPVGVASDGNGAIFVADRGNNRIQQFTSDGVFLKAFGRAGTGLGEFDQPSGVAFDGGVLAVVDAKNDRVQLFRAGNAGA